VLSNVLDFIEVDWSVYRNVHYFIRSTWSVLNFTAVRYSVHKCSETIICLKRQLTVYTCHPFPVHCMGFAEARQTCHRVVRTSIWSIPYSGELCNKNCVVNTSETFIIWSASCYTAGSGGWDAIKGVPDRLIKRVAMVFSVHSRHVELLLTYWCSQSAMIFNFEGTVCNIWNVMLKLIGIFDVVSFLLSCAKNI